jgi:hypothetical protein
VRNKEVEDEDGDNFDDLKKLVEISNPYELLEKQLGGLNIEEESDEEEELEITAID